MGVSGGMRWLVALALAALALALVAAEPGRPLRELFRSERPQRPTEQLPTRDRRRARASWTKRAPRVPSEIASQMMLRASRSSRPYDVPQIGKSLKFCFS